MSAIICALTRRFEIANGQERIQLARQLQAVRRYQETGRLTKANSHHDRLGRFARADGEASPNDQVQAVINRYQGTETWLKAPNGKPSKLNHRQWAEVRTDNFKQWFGDWEKQAQMRFLSGAPIVELSGREFQKSTTPLTERVSHWFKEAHQGKAINPVIGEVALTARGVKDSIAHGLGREKAAAFAAVPNIIRQGVIIDVEKNWKGRGYDGYTLAAPITIAGKNYVGIAVVHRDQQTQRFYLQEAILKEKLQQDPSFKTEALTGDKAALNGDGHTGAIASLLRDIFNVKDSSKVIDENGEPKVFYRLSNFHPESANGHTYWASNPAVANSYMKHSLELNHYLTPAFINARHAIDGENRHTKSRDGHGKVYQAEDLASQRQQAVLIKNLADPDFSASNRERDKGRFDGDIAVVPKSAVTAIKSATGNSGAFSLTDNDITKALPNEEPLAKAYGDNDIFSLHPNPFIRAIVEAHTETGMVRIAKVRLALQDWLDGKHYRRADVDRATLNLAYSPAWTDGEAESVRRYLSGVKPEQFSVDDLAMLSKLLVRDNLPAGAMISDAIQNQAQAFMMGHVQASWPSDGALPTAAQLAAARAEFPATLEGVVAALRLNDMAQEILSYGAQHAAENIVQLTDDLRGALQSTLMNHQLKRLAGDEAATPQKLQQNLFDNFGDMNRDWRRIAITEVGEMANQAFVAGQPEGTKIRRNERDDACPFCQRINGVIYTVVSPDKADKDGNTEIWPGKNNIGRSGSPNKRTENGLEPRTEAELWWPPAGLAHPHCRGWWTLPADWSWLDAPAV